MANNVKIHEIAKAIGITSAELIEVCHRAGLTHIKHHSNSVSPEEAEEVRKTAIRLYRPKEQPVIKEVVRPSRKKKEEKPKPEPAAVERVVPKVEPRLVAPPPPPAAAARPAPTRPEDVMPPKPLRKRKPRPGEDEEESEKQKLQKIRTRTIIFKQPRRLVPERKRETKLEMTSPVTVRELSERIGVPAAAILKDLMFQHNLRANINEAIDDELVQLLGIEHGVEITLKEPRSAEEVLLDSQPEDNPEDLQPRPAVVAMLGHVDHGKTTVLDRIRNTRVAESEAGGITQDIAAWQVESRGHMLTFVDTPGHEAFTAMRARGARVTDIVVLVVAADDGVMPQTVEAISHARAADVPIIVALNKIDKPEANVLRAKQQLAGLELVPEDWGGPVGCVEVSGLTGQGIENLLERIALEAELLEIKANPNRAASGAVLEARMEPGRGVVTDVIVQKGTLSIGDIVVCGDAYGTVRSLYGDLGREVRAATPGQPVAMSGLDKVPEAGETFLVVSDLDKARKVAQERQAQLRRVRLRRVRPRVTLETLYERIQSGETRQLNVILKADVQGSLDPMVKSLAELGTSEVSVRITHSGVGHVSTSDVLLAEASDALIIAFRVREDDKVREMAAAGGVEVRHYDVIYDVVRDLHQALEGMLEPEQREERVGLAEVRQTFHASRYGTIAGCHVTEGSIVRSGRVRVLRDGQEVHTGAMASLRQEKSDVRQVDAGRECGIHMEGFDDVRVGDLIECFRTVTVKRTLAEKRS